MVDVLPQQLPAGLTARPMGPDDVPALAQLLADAEAVDDTGEHETVEDLTGWWVNELVDLPRDSRVVTTADGTPVGWATVIAPPTFRDAFGVYLEGRVHPDHRRRGIGTALLDWQLARAAEVHAERHPEVPARLTVAVYPSMTDLAALVQRAGLVADRWYAHMLRPLTDLPGPREVDGVAFGPFGWDRDDEVRRAHNVAFTEHHGSSERDPASWQVMFTGQRAFRPELSVLAVERDAVVGYVLGYEHETVEGGREAYYGQIGVLPAARGRGIAPAAIARALHAAAGDGCDRAALQVDTGNVTGALRLYESLGFGTARTEVSWARTLPPSV